jgi:heterodisulfide reductase subunit A
MITFKLNGKDVQGEEGEYILQVAERYGIDIPTLCYHKALEPAGMCRLCTVELYDGRRTRFVTACNYPIWESMEVNTDTEAVHKGRKLIVELLLSRCPHVPIIKELAERYGLKEPRFKKENDDCILCGLCTRICERMGNSAISLTGRGVDMKVDTPFHIQTDVCMACGACASVCPTGHIKLDDITKHAITPIPSEYDMGLKGRKPIYVPYAQAVPNTPAIDRSQCLHFKTGGCQICAEFCGVGAIDFTQQDEKIKLKVGSIIIAPGFQPYDPALNDTYQYGRFPNVVTSLEFERILSASGPYEGHLIRPSDKKEPKKIAWIQCVGSRNTNVGDKGYCSAVCCTYAIKQAMVAKEHSSEPLDTAIFFIDIRTYGKDFEKFFNRARDDVGVRFIKSRINNILPGEEEGNLTIRYTDEAGRIIHEEFNIVVLSVGLDIPQESMALAQKMGVELNTYNFVSTKTFEPVRTTKDGIYTCGAFQGPKDIPETVMQASASAAATSGLLADQRHTLTKEKEYPEEIDITGQEPRIGVFVCHCGINIGGVVNVPEVTEYASTLPHVVVTDENLFTCSQDTQDRIKERIEEFKLNRVVVASCSARTHEPLFQDTIREAGLNPYLFSMANIRDQDSWVHQSDKEGATKKAKDLVRMAVANAAELSPLYRTTLPVIKKALIIGGGIAGMTAALNIAQQGFEVVLVEIEKELGGMGRKIHRTLQGDNIQKYVDDLIEKVTQNEKIEVLTETIVVDFSGTKGNFKTALTVGPAMYHREINHGALIVATGALEYTPKEYLYGESDKVKTQVELEDILSREESRIKEWKNVVMIQCVGSRNKENPNCSRVCCQQAIKNGIAIKEINPDINIFILHRDIRTYAFLEDYYRKAREMGIHFLRYKEDEEPKVEQSEGGIQVTVKDLTLGREITFNPDQVILSAGVVAGDIEELANILKVPLTSERFFLEAHVKLRPVDTQSDGIFICGIAHSPRLIDESISQALAASSRACCLLSQDSIEVGGVVATVDPDLCAACLICVRACPYEVPFINADGVSEIDISKCHGCGVCAAECPAKAITLSHFQDAQILAQIDALMETG